MEMVSFGNEGVPAKRSKLDVGELGEDIFAPHGFLIVYLLASLAKIATNNIDYYFTRCLISDDARYILSIGVQQFYY